MFNVMHETDMPGGGFHLTERIAGMGWDGGDRARETRGHGRWEAVSAGDADDPESMVAVSVHGASWSWTVERSRADVKRMFDGDGDLAGRMVREAASKCASARGGSIEVQDIEFFPSIRIERNDGGERRETGKSSPKSK